MACGAIRRFGFVMRDWPRPAIARQPVTNLVEVQVLSSALKPAGRRVDANGG